MFLNLKRTGWAAMLGAGTLLSSGAMAQDISGENFANPQVDRYTWDENGVVVLPVVPNMNTYGPVTYWGDYYGSGQMMTPAERAEATFEAYTGMRSNRNAYTGDDLQVGDEVYVNSRQASVMAGDQALGTLTQGQQLTIKQIQNGWAYTEVTENGRTMNGWVRLNQLQPKSEIVENADQRGPAANAPRRRYVQSQVLEWNGQSYEQVDLQGTGTGAARPVDPQASTGPNGPTRVPVPSVQEDPAANQPQPGAQPNDNAQGGNAGGPAALEPPSAPVTILNGPPTGGSTLTLLPGQRDQSQVILLPGQAGQEKPVLLQDLPALGTQRSAGFDWRR